MWSHCTPRPRGPAWFALVTGEWGSHRVCREATTKEPAPPGSTGAACGSRPGLRDSGLLPGALLAGRRSGCLCARHGFFPLRHRFRGFPSTEMSFVWKRRERGRLAGSRGSRGGKGFAEGAPVTASGQPPPSRAAVPRALPPRLRAGPPARCSDPESAAPTPTGTGPVSPHGPSGGSPAEPEPVAMSSRSLKGPQLPPPRLTVTSAPPRGGSAPLCLAGSLVRSRVAGEELGREAPGVLQGPRPPPTRR